MLFFYRLALFLSPIITAATLLLIFFNHNYFYFGTAFCLIFVFLITYLVALKKLKNWRQKLNHSFFSVLLLASGIFYLIFAENQTIQIAVIVLINLLFFTYLNELFKPLLRTQIEPKEKSTQIFLLLEAVMIFFIASGFLGLRDFLNISYIFLLLPFALLILFLISNLIFQGNKFGLNKVYLSLILTLVLVELFWAIAILSLVYYLKGLIISFCYLVIMEFFFSSLAGKSSKKVITGYLIIIIIILTMVLLTTRWF